MARLHPFFMTLPQNELTPVEHSLRKALLKVLSATDGHPFPLLEWIDRRVGGEIETIRGGGGIVEIQSRGGVGGPHGGAKPEVFLASLPADRFDPPEEALRDAVYHFLATWQSPELANIVQMGAFPEVRKRLEHFLPKSVTLKDWIEHRIGGEIEFRSQRSGPDVVHLTENARGNVMDKYQQIASTRFMGVPPPPIAPPMGGAPPAPPPPLPPMAAGPNKSFINMLPADELLPQEHALREVLIAWLERWQRPAHRPPNSLPLLADAGSDSEIMRCRQDLLPPKAKLADWIERRIGGEVQVRRGGDGQWEIFMRDSVPPPLPEAPPPPPAAGGKGGSASDEAKEQFFNTLPEEDFSFEEDDMRNALLAFLEQWSGTSPPAITDAIAEEEVSRIWSALLPKGCPVTTREWIDRRIGGELETRVVAGGQVIFGLRGQLGNMGQGAKRRKFG